MFTEQQQRFRDLAEVLLDRVSEMEPADAHRVTLAASKAASLARLASYPDAPEDLLDRAYIALNKTIPDAYDVVTAGTCFSLAEQSVRAAEKERT